MIRWMLVAGLTGWLLQAEAQYRPAAENLRQREVFQDDRFGLFVHWGLSSVLADGEWVCLHYRAAAVSGDPSLHDAESLPGPHAPRAS